jgi:hypothetical protein
VLAKGARGREDHGVALELTLAWAWRPGRLDERLGARLALAWCAHAHASLRLQLLIGLCTPRHNPAVRVDRGLASA